MMNLENYRTLFIVATLVVVLVVASPAFSAIVILEDGSEQFSELWLLDHNHMGEDYPFDIEVGKNYSAFLGVRNHMGSSEYYMVRVKLSNNSELLPDTNAGVPSSLSSVFEYRFFVSDGGVWESTVSFRFEDVNLVGDVLSVANIMIDGTSFPVDASAVWDSENQGYFLVLFFELWQYNVESNSFGYDDRVVWLQLNMQVS